MANIIDKIMHNEDEYLIPQHSVISVTLLANGWSNNEQTVSATGVTVTNTVIASPDPSSFVDYTDSIIYCSAQANGTLTFTCDSVPNNDINVNVVILSAEMEVGPTPPSPGWQPGVNTLAYYKMTDLTTTSDEIGNYDFTNNNVTWNSNSGIFYWNSNNDLTHLDNGSFPQFSNGDEVFMGCWIKPTAWEGRIIAPLENSSAGRGMFLGLAGQYIVFMPYNGTWYEYKTAISGNLSEWYYVWVTGIVGQTMTVGVINSNLVTTTNDFTASQWLPGGLRIGTNGNISYMGNADTFKGNIGEIIIEDKQRATQDVQDYVNATKSEYGIS